MDNLFVFDLDGTIIMDNEKINPLICQALRVLHNKGEKVVFATSRSLRGVKEVLPIQLLKFPLILCNGAFAVVDGKFFSAGVISKGEYERIVCFLNKSSIPFYLDMGNELFIPAGVEHDFLTLLKQEAEGEKIIHELSEIKSNVYKIGIVQPVRSDELKKIESIGGRIRIYQHTDKTVDIVPLNCSKWKMLQELKLSQDRKRVIAFGNDTNDIEMIKHADIGVAVCSSNKELSDEAVMQVFDNTPESLVKKIEDICKYLRELEMRK